MPSNKPTETKTFEEALAEFRQLVAIEDYREVPRALVGALDLHLAETEYKGKAHQELGAHVEAIMKHFKELA